MTHVQLRRAWKARGEHSKPFVELRSRADHFLLANNSVSFLQVFAPVALASGVTLSWNKDVSRGVIRAKCSRADYPKASSEPLDVAEVRLQLSFNKHMCYATQSVRPSRRRA